ncbi:hypothetical protein [Bacillus sp. T33-2]|uniref:hypothetical protein n=1 Tax=Bacillus sp. T33-2 TaxID=2054168 RepID=UPI000C7730ED|nr:hypothetical protein [Bacillus sp. T33-2]PLR99661.1 hypothetical protein CVD19_00960 [Bacillus sp. T33-2]
MKSYPTGTTVTLRCTFKNEEGQSVDPTVVKLIIYNHKYEITETINVTTKKEVGEYYHRYVTPAKSQTIIYEWNGEIDGLPSVERNSFLTKFMVGS